VRLPPDLARGLARTAAANAVREFPYASVAVLAGPEDLRLPRENHPAFHGCYDWHSAVHTHWLLVRLLRRHPEQVDVTAVRTVLDAHLTVANLAAETVALRAWPGFERPYGWAWLVALAAECEDWAREDGGARAWADALRPAAHAVCDLVLDWLPRAGRPVRDGTHANTAFALALLLDAAAALDLDPLATAVRAYVVDRFLPDRDAPLRWEPSGQDFLSPALCEADLVRRVLTRAEFASWLGEFWPGLAAGEPRSLLEPVASGDRTDGQLGHLDGLNLSRTAGLSAVAGVLDEGDQRRAVLRSAADAHLAAGLSALVETGYLTTHWLGTFAMLAFDSVDELSSPGLP
jgi:hypothetical protein